MNTKNYISSLAGAIVLAGSAFAQAPDITKIKADAEAGNAEAQARLAIAYFNGNGVAKDEREALKWVQKAADGGSALGQLNLGNMYLNGGCGLKQDPSEAFKWFAKSAEQRHRGGQCMLGESYLFGQGVKKSEQDAAKWFALAAKAGSPRAQGYYAYMLANGLGIERSLEEALAWCKKGAEAGDPGAKQTLPHIQRAFDAEAKTPKSFLGVTFGDQINTVTKYKATKTSDGSAVSHFADMKKPFRRFKGSLNVFGTVKTGKIFKFECYSEEYPKEWAKEDAWNEFQKTCEVIAKKFDSKFVEVKVDESLLATTWDKTAECLVGVLKIHMEVSVGKMKLEVTHLGLEKVAKQEVKAEIDAQGDGSDAL